jgi:hypothetical protein
MTQPIELDDARRARTEDGLEAVNQEANALREVLGTVLTRLGELEERRSFLENRLNVVKIRREVAEEDEAVEKVDPRGVFWLYEVADEDEQLTKEDPHDPFRLFRWRGDD